MVPRNKSDINKWFKLQIIRRLGELLSVGSTCEESCARNLLVGGIGHGSPT